MSQGIEITEELREAFEAEAREYIQKLNDSLLQLERDSGDPELVNDMFRAAHSLKGMAATVGLEEMAKVTHEVEGCLQRLRDGKAEWSQQMGEALFEAVDVLEDMLDQFVWDGQVCEVQRADELVKRLQALADFRPGVRTQQGTRMHGIGAGSSDHMVKVDIGKLDELINLIGQLVITRNRLGALCREGLLLEEAFEEIDHATSGLQDLAMRLRLTPVQNVFQRFPRMVRDLAASLGKKVRLVISGGETELDRAVVDRISEPLVHLLRNAADHGIEYPDERRAKGKPEEGLVKLSARNEGGRVVIEVADDGAGIDPEKVLRKALAKGLVNESQARQMNTNQILELVFQPGFSTRDVASDISGRGVGLDVVKNVVSAMNGVVELDSKVGEGTTVRMHLPVTLAIIQALLLKAGDETYAVPLEFVTENILLDRESVKTILKKPVLEWRGEVLPVLSLRKAVGMDGECTGDYAVVLRTGRHKAVLEVDEILGQQEIVIKSLGKLCGPLQGVSGATILGDGKVSLILDMGSLVN
ncbi:MAG: chemotaxis protein CheA [Bacillota bacterium]